jgi:hypothetical protein
MVLHLSVSFVVLKLRNDCYLSYKLHECLLQIGFGTELLISLTEPLLGFPYKVKRPTPFMDVMSVCLSICT